MFVPNKRALWPVLFDNLGPFCVHRPIRNTELIPEMAACPLGKRSCIFAHWFILLGPFH